jgi:Fic family protein
MIIDPKLYQRIINKKNKLDSLRPLSKSLVKKLKEQVIIEWTYNSNAIEGTSLTLKETELVIEHGLTIKGKPLKEHFEAVNHKEAILFLEELIKKEKFKINSLLIRQIHQLILKNIDKENAGKFRETKVQITGSGYLPPMPSELPVKMKQFEYWLNNKKNKINYLDYTAITHFKLVDIHPFIDGNGRTARLLMNLILMVKGYPPTIILKSDRAVYYRTLEMAHKGELKPFIDFIGRNIERALVWYLDAVLPEKKKSLVEKWQLLSQLAPKTPFSQEYLSLLARRSKLEAVKKGRNWYSNLQAIKQYQKINKNNGNKIYK